MKENDLYQASDFRGLDYFSLKENDLYQGIDEVEGQMLNHFPEGQMKDNVIYQAFDDISPTGDNGGRDLGQCRDQIEEQNLYEEVNDLEQAHEVIHLPGHSILEGQGHSARAVRLPGYKTLEGQGHRAESDWDEMKENDLYCPIPHL
ncbi:uncharacterized protein LOC135486707 [Lineus longissimus]|uniref:uncharacterized protein LOC135486707 n=1 Tax=Lineus longissimus TaxID=88925 RepID=UPI00315D8E96